MDFIFFYSKFSNHCVSLLQEVPLLNDKGVCVDSEASRLALKNLPYKVKRVPTLLVVDGIDKILKVIEGSQDIKNWFILTTYSLSSSSDLQEPRPPQNPENIEDDLMPRSTLDDLGININEEIPAATEPLDANHTLKGMKTMNVKNLAEELQKERESFISNSSSENKRN